MKKVSIFIQSSIFFDIRYSIFDITSAMFVSDCEAAESNHRQGGEYKRLNEANKEFQAQKGHRRKIRNEKSNNDKQHLAREDIPEQPEGERDDLGKFTHNLQDARKGRNGAPEHDEPAEMFLHANRHKPEDVRERNREKRERERHIEVGVHGAENGDE